MSGFQCAEQHWPSPDSVTSVNHRCHLRFKICRFSSPVSLSPFPHVTKGHEALPNATKLPSPSTNTDARFYHSTVSYCRKGATYLRHALEKIGADVIDR